VSTPSLLAALVAATLIKGLPLALCSSPPRSFGDVYTAKDKTTNQVVAIKILKKNYSEAPERICNELDNLRSCHHENIVNYLRSYLFKDHVWVCIPSVPSGPLPPFSFHTIIDRASCVFLSVLDGDGVL